MHVKTCRLWNYRVADVRLTGLQMLGKVLTKQLPATGVRFLASERSTGSRTTVVGTWNLGKCLQQEEEERCAILNLIEPEKNELETSRDIFVPPVSAVKELKS